MKTNGNILFYLFPLFERERFPLLLVEVLAVDLVEVDEVVLVCGLEEVVSIQQLLVFFVQ